MAVLEASIVEISTRGDHGHMVTWGPLAAGDSGSPISMIGYGRRTVQMTGTFGGPARVAIEGSNDGVNYVALFDVYGNKLEFTAAGISTVQDLTLFIRPRTVSGTPSVTIKMLIRKTEAR